MRTRVIRYLERLRKGLVRRAYRLVGIDISAPRPRQLRGGPLQGRALLIDPDSAIEYQSKITEGSYDHFFYEALEESGGIADARIWDVGAHVGYHTLAFAALVGPRGRVVAFEPNPYNAERIQQNLELNPDLSERIVLMACALSNNDGETPFVFSPELASGRSSGSYLEGAVRPEPPSSYTEDHFKTMTVETAKADTLLLEKRVPQPDVIKIDVEGAEHFVLQGAKDLLSHHCPLLLVEVHNITMMFHVQKILFDLGYDIQMLDAEHTSLSRCFILAERRSRPEASNTRKC